MYERYGITDKEYIDKWLEQKGKCEICGKTLEDKYLDVDHNHETGKVRGLLCNECNRKLQDDISKMTELYENEIKYLRKYDQNSNN